MTVGYLIAQMGAMPSGVTLSATTTSGGPTAVSLTTTSTYTPVSLCAHLQAALNAQRPGSGGATWSVSLSTTTGRVTIGLSDSSVFSITWTTATLGTILGHSTITSQTSVTGDAAHGIWIPGCTLDLDTDPRINPMVTDLRESESPTGYGTGLVGNAKYRHRRLRWSHVERARAVGPQTTTPVWQQFLKDVHLGQGHSWFGVRSRIYVYDHTGNALGSDESIYSWQMKGITGTDQIQRAQAGYTGMWRIEIPELISDGSS